MQNLEALSDQALLESLIKAAQTNGHFLYTEHGVVSEEVKKIKKQELAQLKQEVLRRLGAR